MKLHLMLRLPFVTKAEKLGQIRSCKPTFGQYLREIIRRKFI